MSAQHLSPEARKRLAWLEGWAISRLRGAGEFPGADERTDEEAQADERLEWLTACDEAVLDVARTIRELVFLLDVSVYTRQPE